ncbi:hypothetical protein FORC73_2587 [Vibrio cholerae]|nr:hypothetical protein FORC73_2587 [Vibrio cholerae]
MKLGRRFTVKYGNINRGVGFEPKVKDEIEGTFKPNNFEILKWHPEEKLNVNIR